MRKAILLGGLVVAVLVAPAAQAQDEKPIGTATFVCADQKSIVAKFYPDEVALTLKDGRSLALPQVISGSGARCQRGREHCVLEQGKHRLPHGGLGRQHHL